MAKENNLTVKGGLIKSKFFFAPINTGLANNGNPTKELIAFHSKRSNKFTGINYVGNIAIDAEHVVNESTLFINSEMKGYSDLANSIEFNGSIPGAQIASFKSKYQTQRKWINRNPKKYKQHIREEMDNFTLPQIKSIIKSFQQGIIKLSHHGFKVIQIHAAHGYLLNNFLSKNYNHRKDEFGKDNTLIIKEILDGIDSVIRSIIIDLRVSLFEEKIIDTLAPANVEFLEDVYTIDGIDLISISNGIYNINKQLIYPTQNMGHAFMLAILKDFLSSRHGRVWNICGNIWDLHSLKSTADNITYSIGRSVIADPQFIKKSFEGNMKDIVACEFKNKCHYFSLDKNFIECGVNKNLF